MSDDPGLAFAIEELSDACAILEREKLSEEAARRVANARRLLDLARKKMRHG